MDLRRRLIHSLGLLLGGLMVAATLIQLYSLQSDIDAEIGASTRLVGVLLAAGSQEHQDAQALAQQLSQAGLRHLRIRTADQLPAAPARSSLAAWLGIVHPASAERAVRIGGATLYIAPDASSEIEERLRDAVRILGTLLFFFGATLLVAWWSADRALRPVRALEDGLHRLARGEEYPALPPFALREFRRVAGAIEHLAGALRDARASQRALARQLISVQEDERGNLARELHDEMGQTLTALNATAAHLARNAGRLDAAAVAECAGDLRRDIRTSGEQLRAMLKSLRPHGLDADSLAQALRELVSGWRERATGIAFALDMPSPFPALDEAAALAVYRVAQEALTNAVRHSGASRCTLRITATDAGVQLAVEDNGQGLPQSGPARRGGLLGMAERLDMVGGSLHLEPAAGDGLCLTARLPLQRAQASGGREA